jgi:hypothetical protein
MMKKTMYRMSSGRERSDLVMAETSIDVEVKFENLLQIGAYAGNAPLD